VVTELAKDKVDIAVLGRLTVLESDAVAECIRGGREPLVGEPMEAGSAAPNPVASASDAGEEIDTGRVGDGEGTYGRYMVELDMFPDCALEGRVCSV
jgi:hypothetical protein